MIIALVLVLHALLMACLSCAAPTILSLGSSICWTLSNSNASLSLPARVPGYALEILQESGIIGDPLFR